MAILKGEIISRDLFNSANALRCTFPITDETLQEANSTTNLRFFFFVSLNLVLSLATLTFCDFRQNWRLYLTITVINVRQKLKWKHLHSNVVLHQGAQKKDKYSKNRFMGLSYPL